MGWHCFAVTFALLAWPAHAQSVPRLPNKTPYAEARTTLMGLGWQPVRVPEADKCDADDDRCAGRPEMLSCSGTGLARCTFLWRRNDALIEVGTYGEIEPIRVDRVKCRAGC